MLYLASNPYPKAGIWGNSDNAKSPIYHLLINFPETLTWLLLFTCHWSELVLSSSQEVRKYLLPGTWCARQS